MLAQFSISDKLLERKSLLNRKNDPTNKPMRHRTPNRPYSCVNSAIFDGEIPRSQCSVTCNWILHPVHILRYRPLPRRSRLHVRTNPKAVRTHLPRNRVIGEYEKLLGLPVLCSWCVGRGEVDYGLHFGIARNESH